MTKPNAFAFAASLSVICCISSTFSSAQPIFPSAESLEWLIADSPVIVRGRVVDVEKRPAQDGWAWTTVTLKAAEVLQGAVGEEITFVEKRSDRDDDFETWREQARRRLSFPGLHRKVLIAVIDRVTASSRAAQLAPRSRT